MAATHNTNCTASCAPVLYLALDLGASNWKLAFTVGLGQKPRARKLIIVTNDAHCVTLSLWAQQKNLSRNTACCFRT